MGARTGKRRVNLSTRKGEIRRWAQEGYSDAEIAAELGASATSVQPFRSRHRIGRRTGGHSPAAKAPTEVFEGVLESPPPTREGQRRLKRIWFDPAVADTDAWAAG